MSDDKELDSIVDKMIANGESEANIGAVIQAYGEQRNAPKPGSGLNKPIKSASTWGQGVMDSLTSGEAAMAGLKGLGGWIKGAVNIPKTVMGTLDTASKLPNPMMGGVTNMSGGITNPEELNQIWEGLKSTPGHMLDTTKRAGSDPVAFGEMVGELTGQPLLTEGLGMIPASSVASATRAVGRGVKRAGSVVEKHTPVSKVIPPITRPELVPAIERAAGRGIAKIGDSMSKVGTPRVLQNSDYGPIPYTAGERISPTADLRGSAAFPETSTTPRELIQNADYEAVPFTPEQPLIARNNRGAMSYPEMNDTPPSLMQNNQYGPTDEFVNSVLAPGGEMRGSMASPEMSMRPTGLVQNADYGPVDFTPDQPLINPTGRDRGGMSYPELNDTPPSFVPNQAAAMDEFIPGGKSITGPNKGGMHYPEMNDTPPSLVPNSQAGLDEFTNSVMAPTGEMRGSMYSPEMNPMPQEVMHNSDYGPGYSSSPVRNSDWGTQTPNPNKMNLWAEPYGADTAIINPPQPPAINQALAQNVGGYGPKATDFINRQKGFDKLFGTRSATDRTGRSPLQMFEEDQFLKSLDWEPDTGPNVGFNPRDLSDIVRDVTKKEVDVIGPTGEPISPRMEKPVSTQRELPPAQEWKPPSNKNGPTLETIEDGPLTNNASGESGASVEAMNRLKAMRDKGEVFVVYSKGGKKRPLIGADAVDYVPKKGETFGIQSPSGFKILQDNGGITPRSFMRQ